MDRSATATAVDFTRTSGLRNSFFDTTRSISNAISSPTKVCPCLTLKSPSRTARATTYPQSVSCLNRRSSLMRD